MEQKQTELFTLQDEIITAFRPIELIFKIIDTSSTEIYGELTHSFSGVGKELCQNFRCKLNSILKLQSGDSSNE